MNSPSKRILARKRSGIILWLLIALSIAGAVTGCLQASPPQSTQTLATETPPVSSAMPTSTFEATLASLPRSPTLTSIPTAAPLYPALVKICPSNPIVPVDKVGLDHNSRLLLVPETSESYWDDEQIGLFVLAPDSSTPQRISAFFQSGQINSRACRISPNGQWVVFQRKAKGAAKGMPWVGSIDGARQWALTSDQQLESGYWLSDDSVLLSSGDGTNNQLLNPFTMQGEVATSRPSSQNSGIGSKFFQSGGRTYLIYQDGNEYHLYDIVTQQDRRILEWLQSDPASIPEKGVLVRPGGLLIVLVIRPYGFDMSAPMTVRDLVASGNYAQTMRRIIFPQEIMPAGATNGLSMSTSTMIVEGEGQPSHFYLLDHQQGVIKDYCFAKDVPVEISPDGRFVTFTHLVLPHSPPILKSTYILNLETGHYSQIDHYDFMAWAQTNP